MLRTIAVSTSLLFAVPASSQTLTVHGDLSPGGSVVVRVAGPPGAPALLFSSAGFLDPPAPTAGGPFWLDLSAAWFLLPLGTVPPAGELVFPAVVPASPPLSGTKVHLQAAVQKLGNPVGLSFHAPAIPVVAAQPAASERFGSMLAGGDFDGDGFEDVAVHTSAGNTGAGQVSIFFGPLMTPGPVLNDPTPQPGGGFGLAMDVGDKNGDGSLDLAIGAAGAGPSVADDTGEVFVVDAASGAVLASLAAPGGQPGEGFGTAVAFLDHDGDGMLDLAVGAPGAVVSGLVLAGEVHLFDGGLLSAGVLAEPVPEAQSIFGGSMAAGDLDLDGRDDLVVGAPAGTVAGVVRAGEAFRFTGPISASDASFAPPTPTFGGAFACRIEIADLRGGPGADVIVGTPGGAGSATGNPLGIPNVGEVGVFADGDPGALLLIDDPTPEFFQHFGMDVSALDVDGDGSLDLLVGAFLGDVPGAPDAGEAFVFLGPKLVERYDFTAPVPQAAAQFGVFGIGADTNNDGRDELVISAALEDLPGAADAGRVYVIPFE